MPMDFLTIRPLSERLARTTADSEEMKTRVSRKGFRLERGAQRSSQKKLKQPADSIGGRRSSCSPASCAITVASPSFKVVGSNIDLSAFRPTIVDHKAFGPDAGRMYASCNRLRQAFFESCTKAPPPEKRTKHAKPTAHMPDVRIIGFFERLCRIGLPICHLDIHGDREFDFVLEKDVFFFAMMEAQRQALIILKRKLAGIKQPLSKQDEEYLIKLSATIQNYMATSLATTAADQKQYARVMRLKLDRLYAEKTQQSAPGKSFPDTVEKARHDILKKHAASCFTDLVELNLDCKNIDSPTGAFIILDAFQIVYRDEFEKQKKVLDAQSYPDLDALYAAHDKAIELAIFPAVRVYQRVAAASGQEKTLADARAVLTKMGTHISSDLREYMQAPTPAAASPRQSRLEHGRRTSLSYKESIMDLQTSNISTRNSYEPTLPSSPVPSRRNVSQSNTGFRIERDTAGPPANRFFSGLRNWFGRSSRPNHEPLTTWDKPSRSEFIAAPLPARIGVRKSARVLAQKNDLRTRAYLATQPLLLGFIEKRASEILHDYQREHALNVGSHQWTTAEAAYLSEVQSKSPYITMPTVLNLLPSRTDLLMGHPVTILHYELFKQDFGFEPSSQFLEMMQSLWKELDVKKCEIYKEQRQLILASSAPPFTRQKIAHSAERDNIAGPKMEVDYPLCNNADIGPESEEKEMPDNRWKDIQRISAMSRPTPVSQLARDRRPLKAYGFSIGDYRRIQQSLEESIKNFVDEFLESHQHAYDISPAGKGLTLAERQYLHDIKSKPPQLTMPHILSSPPAQTIPQESEEFYLYCLGLGFEPSQHFRQILGQLWTGIHRKKRDIYHRQTVLAKAKDARRNAPPFQIGMR
jgi:hypothetical protein